MGCISSKVISKSLSYREEKEQSLDRTTKPIPFLKDLLSSRKGSDQCLTLVCAADAIANKLRSRSSSSNATSTKLSTEPASSPKITKKRDFNQETPEKPEEKQLDIDLNKRAKSSHWLPQHSASFLDQQASDEGHAGAVRCRSFHTVEEYDALVEKLRQSRPSMDQEIRSKSEDDPSRTDVHFVDFESLSNGYDHTENENNMLKENEEKRESAQDSCLGEEWTKTEATDNSDLASETKRLIENPDSHNSNSGPISGLESGVSEGAAQVGNFVEKGLKRKTVAKRLNSITIPSDIECPPIASLREWLPPAYHVTPEHGTYSSPNNEIGNGSNDTIFSTEMVGAIQQCMRQFEAEEESLLKQWVENIEEKKTAEYDEITPPTM